MASLSLAGRQERSKKTFSGSREEGVEIGDRRPGPLVISASFGLLVSKDSRLMGIRRLLGTGWCSSPTCAKMVGFRDLEGEAVRLSGCRRLLGDDVDICFKSEKIRYVAVAADS